MMLSEVEFTVELQPLVYNQSTNLAIDLSYSCTNLQDSRI